MYKNKVGRSEVDARGPEFWGRPRLSEHLTALRVHQRQRTHLVRPPANRWQVGTDFFLKGPKRQEGAKALGQNWLVCQG